MVDNVLNPDNTRTPGLDTTSLAVASEAIPPWDDGDPTQAICSSFAAQIALARLVLGLRFQIGSFENLLRGTGSYGPTKTFKINHVTFDWPDSADEIQPFNAAIIERSPQAFDDDIGPYMLSGFWKEVYTLRCLSKTTCQFGLVAWFGHTNERRAFRAALVRSMLAEPRTERGSRVINVPEYYGQNVRLILSDVVNSDDEDGLGNHRKLQASVTAFVPEIVAVRSPKVVKVQVMPNVGVSVEP